MMTITIDDPIIENYFHSPKEIEEILKQIVLKKQNKKDKNLIDNYVNIIEASKNLSQKDIKNIIDNEAFEYED